MNQIHFQQDFYHWFSDRSLICGACRRQLVRIDQIDIWQGIQIHMLYEYNDFLEQLLFQYKEGGDVVLRDLFFHEDRDRLKRRYRGYTMVLIPSAAEKNEERGFYALAEMVSKIDLPKVSLFYKSENRKQSTLSYEKRQAIHEVIHLRKDVILPKGKLLLVDDVCTSGATLACAYHLLQPFTKQIEALVLSVNPRFLKGLEMHRHSLWRKGSKFTR